MNRFSGIRRIAVEQAIRNSLRRGTNAFREGVFALKTLDGSNASMSSKVSSVGGWVNTLRS